MSVAAQRAASHAPTPPGRAERGSPCKGGGRFPQQRNSRLELCNDARLNRYDEYMSEDKRWRGLTQTLYDVIYDDNGTYGDRDALRHISLDEVDAGRRVKGDDLIARLRTRSV